MGSDSRSYKLRRNSSTVEYKSEEVIASLHSGCDS